MRTIKFRGKDIETGKWVYGFYVCLEDISRKPIDGKERITHRIYTGFADSCASQDGYDFYGDWHEIAPETVGQFTGVLDGRNQEIYENDIVATYFDGHCTYQGEVRFEAGRFIVSTNNGLLTNIGGKSWLVIGNIHDNPELLEGGAK